MSRSLVALALALIATSATTLLGVTPPQPAAAATSSPAPLALRLLGTYTSGLGAAASETVAAERGRLYITNAASNSLDITVHFRDFNAGGRRHAELSPDIRVFGPNTTVAQDLEPEYIAVSADSRTAYVALQENNAIAVIDVLSGRIERLLPLGYKDHHVVGSGLDASDRDELINIRPWPVKGTYQPDAIAAYQVGGATYLVSANEGDARDYPGFSEEARVGSLTLDPAVFPNATELQQNVTLGRLNVTRTLGQGPNGEDRPEPLAPEPDGFEADLHLARCQQLLHVGWLRANR